MQELMHVFENAGNAVLPLLDALCCPKQPSLQALSTAISAVRAAAKANSVSSTDLQTLASSIESNLLNPLCSSGTAQWSPEVLSAKEFCCEHIPGIIDNSILYILSLEKEVQSEELLLFNFRLLASLLENPVNQPAVIAKSDDLFSLSLRFLCVELPELHSCIASTVIPAFLKIVGNPHHFCEKLWTSINSANYSERVKASLLVNCFNSFFGLVVSQKRSHQQPRPKESNIKKKFRRTDAKEGIITGGGNSVMDEEFHKLDEYHRLPNDIPLDLRLEDYFWEFLANGLVCGDPLTQKYCLFLLKRAIDYTAKYTVSTLKTKFDIISILLI
ncbi:hypothetical protein HDU83_002298 [Entophlyctis luteolus]|nr:hypothetical protein HDU83_002298 [Entophlyctis luteolus]